MKKMIFIAAMIGGMLIPAQMVAQNNREKNNPNVDLRGNRQNNDKEVKDKKNDRDDKQAFKPEQKPNNKPDNDKQAFKPEQKPNNKPGKPAIRPDFKPDRRAPKPVPQVRRDYDYDNDVAEAAVVAVGLAALVALIAN